MPETESDYIYDGEELDPRLKVLCDYELPIDRP